ncbi:indole-3-glycerol-phosphate synthase [Actinomycetota bacterium]
MRFLKEILIAKKKGLGSIKSGLESNGNAGYGNNADGSMQEKRFIRNISTGRINIIAEIKKASPSKGIINSDLDVSRTARTYNKFDSFISGLSVLTEPLYFKGDGGDVTLAKEGNTLPILRKDFIFSELQLYESVRLGADCILLISSLLSYRKLKKLYRSAGELGLDVLVETHHYKELVNAIDMGAELIGINNRNLKKMKVDNEHIVGLLDRLPGSLPKGIKLVCESGVNDLDYIERLFNMGVDTFLIGTYFMQSPDLENALDRIRKGLAARELI